jgi:parallel beta-helix repeat protein
MTNSEIWGKVLTIAITLAMIFSTGFVFSGKATAETISLDDDSTPPIPPFMIWGTVYNENNVPIPDATVTVKNLMTGESLDADVYENGAYDAELEDLQYGYSIGDEIEITATAGENTASKIILVKQMGFGELIDIHFGNDINSIQSENPLASRFESQEESPEFNMMADYERQPMPARPQDSNENPNTIYIDSPALVTEESEPEISLVDIRRPPYFRLAFTEKENNLRIALSNDGDERRIVIVDLYHVEPDGVTESFLKTVHFGAIPSGQTKTTDAFGKNEDMWTPTQTDRNWIRGEIYIKGHGNELILVNEFKESFNVVPGWRPVLTLGHTTITEPIIWENLTVVIDGDLTVNAPLELVNTDVIGDNLTVNAEYIINPSTSHDMGCQEDGQYKVEVNSPDGILTIYGKLTNNDYKKHYWFYVNNTLEVDAGGYPGYGIVENVMGSPDLSQPGGIICTTDNVRIENGAEVRYSKTHGVWLEGSDAVISGAKIHDNGGDGIVCVDGSAPQIELNNISWNTRYGIRAEDSAPMILGNDPIQFNRQHGIYVNNVWSASALIDYNNIKENFGSGIYATNTNITISNNMISSNGLGLKFRDDMENGYGNWHSTGQWDMVNNQSGAASGWNLSHSGDWSWWYGTNKTTTGNYDDGTRNWGNLTCSGIDITNARTATFVFWSWYETDTAGTATDQRWITIGDNTNYLQIQLSGEQNRSWTKYVINISRFAGSMIYLDFGFDTMDAYNNAFQGWYIDDVEVIAAYPYPDAEGHGIVCEGLTPANIHDNTLTSNNWNGVYCIGAENTQIVHNTVSSNLIDGIALVAGSSNVTIQDNDCLSQVEGIQILSSSNNVVNHNTLSYNVYGLYVGEASSNNNITNNTVSSNYYGGIRLYFKCGSNKIINNTISWNNWYGIYNGAACGGNIIADNTVFRNGVGIQLRRSGGGNTIDHNTVSSNDIGIYISASSNNIIINNTASSNTYGICLDDSSRDNFIVNNTAMYNGAGIILYYGRNNNVETNTVSNNANGIYLDFSDDNIITDNTASNNDCGIYLSYSSNNTFTNNMLVNNGFFIRGDQLWHWNTHIIDTKNNVNGNPVHYWKNQVGGTVPLGAGQVLLANCSQVIIEKQNIHDATVGIELGYSDNNTIADTVAMSNIWVAIYLFNSNSNTIVDGVYSNNGDGIYLYYSENNFIIDNNVDSNLYWGIFLGLSSNNLLTSNFVTSNNLIGIFIDVSNDNIVIKNTISNNGYGVSFYAATGNQIINSTITNSGSFDFYLESNSHATALSTTFNHTKVYFTDGLSTLTVQWFLHVRVVGDDFAPVDGASVWVLNSFGSIVFTSITPADGWIKWIRATEYIQSQTTKTNYTAHKITASNATLTGWAEPEPFMDRNMYSSGLVKATTSSFM